MYKYDRKKEMNAVTKDSSAQRPQGAVRSSAPTGSSAGPIYSPCWGHSSL